jgi:hypothetical protein
MYRFEAVGEFGRLNNCGLNDQREYGLWRFMNQEIMCQRKLNTGGAETFWQGSWRECERFGASGGIVAPTLGSRTALSEKIKNKDASVVPARKVLLWYARMSVDRRALGMVDERVIYCRTGIRGRP